MRRIIPDAYKIKVFGTKHPILNIIADEISKSGEKDIKQALEIVKNYYGIVTLLKKGSLQQKA
jgi:hypothetical protein